MIKSILMRVFGILLFPSLVFAQRPLEYKDVASWPFLRPENTLLSSNGKFIAYDQWVANDPIPLLIISGSSGKPVLSVPGGLSVAIGFTNDSKLFLYKKTKDSVAIFDLATRQMNFIPAVKQLVIPYGNYSSKVLWQNNSGELFFSEPQNKNRMSLTRVKNFQLAKDNKTVLLISTTDNNRDKWDWLDLTNRKISRIASGSKYSDPVWSETYGSLAFLETDDKVHRLKWFDKISSLTRELCNDHILNAAKQLTIDKINKVHSKNASIELQLKSVKNPSVKINDINAKVTIWSYFDQKLQPAKPQLPVPIIKSYKSIFLMGKGQIQQLENDSTRVFKFINGWYSCAKNEEDFFIVSSVNGNQRNIKGLPGNTLDFLPLSFSADGNYSIHFYNNQFYQYDINRQTSKPISVPDKKVVWHTIDDLETETGNYGAAGWNPEPLGGSLFRVRDQYDIWILDASGKRAPVCITNGYGTKNKIIFDVLRDNEGKDMYFNGKLLLSAFGAESKKAGYFTCHPNNPGDPVQLVFDDFYYDRPIKSMDGRTWIFAKQATDMSSNLFLTGDFKDIKSITAVHPEKAHDWITSELLDGKLPDGRLVQAVIYKPKKLDSTKKYPVIFNYYEAITNAKNQYKIPGLTRADINIPWFVSRGYVVIEADMVHYRQGYTGQSALNCINAIADQVVKIEYVDSNKLGLMGHSFGGFETLYFVTHSNRFSAALSSAGLSDMISGFSNDHTRSHIESRQYRIGSTMWEKPNLFIANSPILTADKVTTPLLMMHNPADGSVPFSQGLEFFMAMRRLGKPCWLLEYESNAHVIDNFDDQIDYTIRIEQFFNHYLKGAPAPLWMIEGQKYRNQQYMPGYELDSLGRKPGQGINSAKEQKKIEGYSKIPLVEKIKNFK